MDSGELEFEYRKEVKLRGFNTYKINKLVQKLVD